MPVFSPSQKTPQRGSGAGSGPVPHLTGSKLLPGKVPFFFWAKQGPVLRPDDVVGRVDRVIDHTVT